MLFRADLVIADLSTANVNAVYELGVRHGLRPNSTIMMVESKGEFYFDLNHINTFKYEHLGTDIGYQEAIRARRKLENLIKSAMLSQKPDSPVYTYIPKLKQPMLADEQYKELVNETEAFQDNLSNLIEAGKHAMSASSFGDAITAFSRANQLTQNDPFVLQQLALATYKFKKPTELEALHAGLAIIKQLLPDDTNDPETLGITGAIHKRLWLATKNATHLDFAIQYYNRGYEVRRDYYNGENLALCHDYQSTLQTMLKRKFMIVFAQEKHERLS